jgi:hypothetical protein
MRFPCGAAAHKYCPGYHNHCQPHITTNAERPGERWRRTQGARIREQVPPAAIRSTEKLGLARIV